MAEATIDSGTLHALIDETKAARDHYKWDIAKGEGTMCESSKVEHEYASKGVAGSGLGLGIAGTALGLLRANGGLGGILGGGSYSEHEADKLRAELAQVKSERYTDQAIVGERNLQLQWAKELASQDARIAALADAAGKAAEQNKADIACLKENMMLQMQIAKLETEKESCKCASRLEAQINQVANTAAMGIQQNANGLACLQNIVNGLYKIVVPIDAVCPTPMPKFNSWTAPTTAAAPAA